MKKINKTGTSTDPWRNTSSYRSPTRLSAADDIPLSSAIQPVLNPPHWPLIQLTLPELPQEDILADSVESLAEV